MIHLSAIGRLGKDAETKTLEGGKKVINFSVAVDTGWGDNKKTVWLECAKFGENTKIAEYLKKGTQVHVMGEPSVREWDGKDGVKNFSFQCRVNDITLCGDGKKADGSAKPAAAASGGGAAASNTAAPVDDLPF